MAKVLVEEKELGDIKTNLTALNKKYEDAAAEVTRLKVIADQPASATGLTMARLAATPIDHKEEGRLGWKSMSEQLLAIKDVACNKASAETVKRLMEPTIKAATGMGEGVGPDGGFLLAPTYAEGVLEILINMDNILDRLDKYEIAGPSVKIRAYDETSRATGSRRGGVRGFWVDEGATISASKPKFRMIELSPHKLAVLSYVTEELLADGGAMLEQMTSRNAAEEINFLVGDAVFNGSGTGKPLGVLNSACTVSVAKETGQAAKSIVTENIAKMWARMHSSARKNAVWFINQDTEPQLNLMTLGVGTGGVVTYMPPGGVSEAPYATLMGRPVVEIEWAQTLGTVGDIMLCDLKQFVAATRGSVRAATSMHIAFLTDELAYRFTFRLAGQPWWNAALTPFNGTNTLSPFVTLATR